MQVTPSRTVHPLDPQDSVTHPRPRWLALLLPLALGTACEDDATGPEDTAIQLTDGVPVTGLTGRAGEQTVFRIDVPPDDAVGAVLQVRTMSGVGDADLLVRRGSPGTSTAADCVGVLLGNLEVCSLANPEPGTWFVTLQAFRDYEGLDLEASLEPLVPVVDGVPETGLSSSRLDLLYFTFVVPGAATSPSSADGTSRSSVVLGKVRRDGYHLLDPRREGAEVHPPSTASGGQAAASSLAAAATGATGSLGLVGTTSGRIAFTEPTPPECSSLVEGDADCVVDDPAAGPWTFALFAFQSFDDVTFEVELDP